MLRHLEEYEEDYFQSERDEGPKRITATALAKRGWTQKMIRELLGEPDARSPNRRYPDHPPLKLYDLERVEEAERTDLFSEMLDQSEARKDAGAKGKARQLEKTFAAVEEFNIQVPILELNLLQSTAMGAYYERKKEHEVANSEIDDSYQEVQEVNESSIIVLFLRWNTPGYQELHTWLLKRAGARKARRRLKQRVLQAIAVAYPDLGTECARQYRGALWPKEKKTTTSTTKKKTIKM